MKTYHTTSSEATKRIGEKFAAALLAAKLPTQESNATVVILSGELGAGKTTFVQGFFKGAGIKKRAQSPTFVLVRRYKLSPRKKFANIFHIDAYRLKSAAQLAPLAFQEILADPKNLLLIEWGEQIKSALPKSARWLRFHHGKKENERTVTIKEPPKQFGPQRRAAATISKNNHHEKTSSR
jgi:tRNA threonylcarbamoyladenosine biosynthesis protein TsaE